MNQSHPKVSDLSIELSGSMLAAIKQMDTVKTKLLIVLKESKYHSMLSIGDIQRALIKGKPIQTNIAEILRPKHKVNVAHEHDSFDEIKNLIIEKKVEFMPVINDSGDIIKIHFGDEITGLTKGTTTQKIDCPVVIMAGGKGTRLKPLTNVIPKALVPVGEKPIIEKIIDRFNKVGIKDVYLTVNYKYELIEQYFKSIEPGTYDVHYIIEDDFLGTAGSLYYLKNKINETFFVSNCDILIEQDYTEIFEYHKTNKNELTIVGGLKHYPIPYGTLKTAENGLLTEIQEKPELTFMVNTGMYVLEPHLLKEIPEKKFFHITELIEKVRSQNRKVGVFPVSEKSWVDIGQWNDYIKGLDNLAE